MSKHIFKGLAVLLIVMLIIAAEASLTSNSAGKEVA